MPLVDRQTPRPETGETSTGMPVDSDKPTLGTPGVTTDAAPTEITANAAADAVRGAVESTVPEQSRAEWKTSYEVADFDMPTGREEGWRFTPLTPLAPLFADEAGSTEVDVAETLPAGVTSSRGTVDDWKALTPPKPADRVAAVAANRAPFARIVDVPAETELDEPIRLRLTGTGGLSHGLLAVRVGAFSKATIVLEHAGTGTHGQVVTVLAGDGAQVSVVTVQEWDDDAVHVGQHDVVVGRDATVRHVAVSLGGALVRVSTNAFYAGTGGTFEGLGVSFADAGQHLEHRLFVDHEAPRCSSDVLYKSALQGEGAHTVWIGDVLIRAAAEGTDTYELNRNLLLTDGARADSVPNLEIETGEIAGAGHASATGRFDDLQLFYLQARGIPEDEARRLVVRGFFADIVERIGVAEVSGHLMERIEAELALDGARE
ncbi:Fe-S cluster assembly protein SufD [Mobilicoccus pelagius]|uniref:FeS assembly protein SufD n=1 Tax=Mobilicoccus pelagius NBRC 104925 TaxID=1089455 RepID=H5UTM7_9MICO|nr:Fe-S cluster assembly protein SufD [Mobilicoccus pelagius]GAB49085.1 FeS assembly protein SufD [Mobilicoccus pelagius NBRC 104925]